MTKKITHCSFVILVIACNLHCMELVIDDSDSKTPKNKSFFKSSDSDGTKNKNTVKISDPDDEIKLSSKTKKLDPSAGSQKGSVFNLDLNALNKSKSVRTIPKTPKTSVGSRQEFAEQINGAKKTHRNLQTDRSSSSPQTTRRIPQPESDSDNIINNLIPQKSMLPRVLIGKNKDTLLADLQVGSWSDEEVWEIVQYLNPVVYEYAKKNHKDLDFVIVSSKLVNDMKVKPRVMDQFVNDHHKLDVKDSHDTIIQGYKKIKKENPEYWATLLLEMIEAVDGEENGSNSSATLTNMNGTHMGLLHDQIAVEKNDKFKLCVVIAVKALILVGGFAWAIYGQVTGMATHTPTNAPTNSPTYGPTFSPTQSPT